MAHLVLHHLVVPPHLLELLLRVLGLQPELLQLDVLHSELLPGFHEQLLLLVEPLLHVQALERLLVVLLLHFDEVGHETYSLLHSRLLLELLILLVVARVCRCQYLLLEEFPLSIHKLFLLLQEPLLHVLTLGHLFMKLLQHLDEVRLFLVCPGDLLGRQPLLGVEAHGPFRSQLLLELLLSLTVAPPLSDQGLPELLHGEFAEIRERQTEAHRR
mmetsp:Transcript_149414/g.416446  ORF Transcript_149414/g.416446 Transcript_149414/m.416446 type:complete len:215 (-) Transcript_149414:119-763(-)